MTSIDQDIFSEAKSAFIEGNYKVAEPILNQMVLQGFRNPEVFQMLATIFYDKGQFNKAIKTFRRALEIDPTYTDASVGLSILLNDLGKYEEGKRVFNEAQSILERKKSRPGADPWVDEKLASKHEELADLYFQYGRYFESLEQLLKALKLSTKKPDITMRIAECYLKMQDADKAVKELKALIREYPHYIPGRIKLGLIFYQQQNLADATEQWENVLLRDPGHLEARKYLRMAQAAGITTLNL